MNTIIGEIASGDKFVAKDWNEAVTEFYSDKTNRAHIEFSKNSISSEEYKKASQNRVGTKISEKDIAETIKHGELLFNGRLNKYEKLDEDQKKLFIIALMMMDKGAIGMVPQVQHHCLHLRLPKQKRIPSSPCRSAITWRAEFLMYMSTTGKLCIS